MIPRRRIDRIALVALGGLALLWWFMGRGEPGRTVGASSRPWPERLLVEAYGEVAPAPPAMADRRLGGAVIRLKDLYRRELDRVTDTTPPPTPQELVRVGRMVRDQMRRSAPPSRDAAAAARLATIVERLRAVIPDGQGDHYDLELLETDAVNAYMGPGGLGAVLRGLLDRLDDHALAFVVAHELAHGVLGHCDRMVHRSMAMVRVKQRVEGATGVDLPDDLAAVAQKVSGMPYDEELEFEADRLGLALAWKAGYSPSGMVVAMDKLGAGSGRAPRGLARIGHDMISSHPHPEIRRRYGNFLAATIGRRHP